jgi:hypothetical protein
MVEPPGVLGRGLEGTTAARQVEDADHEAHHGRQVEGGLELAESMPALRPA